MIKIIGLTDIATLKKEASSAKRLRSHLNLHKTLDAPVQRLFIATNPDTYMRPHRHPEDHKWEFLIVLEGQLDLLIFNDDGVVTQRVELAATKNRAVEIPPMTWHAYVCKVPGTLALEIKEGAYIPTTEENFAPWSPAENTSESAKYLSWMKEAKVV